MREPDMLSKHSFSQLGYIDEQQSITKIRPSVLLKPGGRDFSYGQKSVG
jgi:hypothetical protein